MLGSWQQNWLLNFNASKCVVLKTKQSHNFHYSLIGTFLTETEDQRDLGVIISNNLNPHKHIQSSIKKATQRIGLSKCWFTSFPENKLKILYTTLIKPVSEYRSPVWSPRHKCDINDLENPKVVALDRAINQYVYKLSKREKIILTYVKPINLCTISIKHLVTHTFHLCSIP